jgi:RNA polymerase sigma factor (sigma-70 family)
MSDMPATSITLLRAVSSGAESIRWTEFVQRYDGLMRTFLGRYYPTLEADDVIQDVLVSLTKALPGYSYTPDEKGHFHNYLLGVVRHKAVDAVRRNASEDRKRKGFADAPKAGKEQGEETKWREDLMHAALEQLMADGSIAPRNREIFRHVALLGEAPEQVASDFGVSRGNVDVIKKRMVDRLQTLVSAMLENG